VHRLICEARLHGGSRELITASCRSARHDHGRPGRRRRLPAEAVTSRRALKYDWLLHRHSARITSEQARVFLPTVHGFGTNFRYIVSQLDAWNTRPHPTIAQTLLKCRWPAQTWSRYATDQDDPPNARSGENRDAEIEDAGPAYPQAMETSTPFVLLPLNFMTSRKDHKPFFVWLNPTRMHNSFTHLSPKLKRCGNSGEWLVGREAGMAQLDERRTLVMKKLMTWS